MRSARRTIRGGSSRFADGSIIAMGEGTTTRTKRTSTVIGRRAHGTRHVLVPAPSCPLPLAILLRQCRLFALSGRTVIATDDGSLRRVPDSDAAFTLTQVRDLFFAPDWHPGDHPPMPDIVARGRKPDVFTCGVCHRADGSGGRKFESRGTFAELMIR